MNFLVFIFIFLDFIDCLYSKCHPVKPDVINVHLVPHSHDDTGYRKTVDEYFYGLNNDANVFSGGTKGGIQYTIYSVQFHFRWLEIKGIYTDFPTPITLFPTF